VDDYCPRERRVTNHAVVAMIEEGVKQTRCTTCDAEHPYKGGKAPRRKKKEAPDALYKEVLAGITDNDAPPALAAPVVAAVAAPASPLPAAVTQVSTAALADELEEIDEPEDLAAADLEPVEEGPVHRQLIRATLPRLEGQKDERRPTDFTIRQPGSGRPNPNFRGEGGRPRSGQGQQGQYGNRPPGNGGRSAGPRPAGGQGRSGGAGRPQQGGGFRAAPSQGQGQGRGSSGGGRKRSR
jgi:translation initiation factor IF-2